MRMALEILEPRCLAHWPTPLPYGVVGPALVYERPPDHTREDMSLVSFYGSETGSGTFTFYGQCVGNYEGGHVTLTSATLNPPVNGQATGIDGTGLWSIVINNFKSGTSGVVTATAYEASGQQRNSLQDTISVT